MEKNWMIKIVFGLVIILVIFVAGVYSKDYFTGQAFHTGGNRLFGTTANKLSAATCSTINATQYYLEGGPTQPFLPATGSGGVDVFSGNDYCDFYGYSSCTGVYLDKRLIRSTYPANGNSCNSILIDVQGHRYYDVSSSIVPSATYTYPSRIRICCV